MWRGGRAVECTSLENWRTFAGLVSSNLTLSDLVFGHTYRLALFVKSSLLETLRLDSAPLHFTNKANTLRTFKLFTSLTWTFAAELSIQKPIYKDQQARSFKEERFFLDPRC